MIVSSRLLVPHKIDAKCGDRFLQTFTGLIPPWKPDSFQLADHPELGILNSVSGRRLGLPSPCFLCIIEYALGNREAQWRVLKAKTNEMPSSTPRPTYLRSAVLP